MKPITIILRIMETMMVVISSSNGKKHTIDFNANRKIYALT